MDYTSFIHEYYELDLMELVTGQLQNNKQFYYIPHHAVFKESSYLKKKVE